MACWDARRACVSDKSMLWAPLPPPRGLTRLTLIPFPLCMPDHRGGIPASVRGPDTDRGTRLSVLSGSAPSQQ